MKIFPSHDTDVICLFSNEPGKSSEFRPLGRAEETGEWNGIQIIKEVPEKGHHNPITVQDLITALDFFGIPPEDVNGLDAIVISGRSPYTDELNSGWAFGAYQVIWEERRGQTKDGRVVPKKTPKENRLILWAQKIEKVQFNVGGELREGYYYRVQPIYNGRAVDRYISVRALRREILGDTIAHEIGHHVDIWHYGRFVKNASDRKKAEKFAESYSELHTRNKVNLAEFESIIDGTYANRQGEQGAVNPQPQNGGVPVGEMGQPRHPKTPTPMNGQAPVAPQGQPVQPIPAPNAIPRQVIPQ